MQKELIRKIVNLDIIKNLIHLSYSAFYPQKLFSFSNFFFFVNIYKI